MKLFERPLVQLTLVRLKGFFREPEAIFWTYGFPLLMIIGLGIAFRNQPEPVVSFDVVEALADSELVAVLKDSARFEVAVRSREAALHRLRRSKTVLVLDAGNSNGFAYHLDATNPEARAARVAVDDALQRAAGRVDPLVVEEVRVTAPGSRYVDFLVPGLIGMNLMGGGLWGIGFSLVDLRVRKMLKRLLATPMRRSDFLLSMIGMRAMFFIPEMAVLLLVAYLIFAVPIRGSLLDVVLIALVGSLCFAGLGLLVACRARRIETVSGLMNLVMLPMWLASGIFFSSERFPDWSQPLVQALPLTQLNNALRSVILEGDGLAAQGVPLLILAAWGGVSFFVALRWFRWTD